MNTQPSDARNTRELELGTFGTYLNVDVVDGDNRTVSYIISGTDEDDTADVVYDLDPAEAQSVIKTLQDALERNNERNVVGYPATTVETTGAPTQFQCPQCGELLDADTLVQCDECEAQIELTARVTGRGNADLPPK